MARKLLQMRIILLSERLSPDTARCPIAKERRTLAG